MTQNHFPAAFAYTMKNEGGYVDHPADRGGPTNHGVTLRTLSAHRGAVCTADDVRCLEASEAHAIYEARYWRPAGCHLLIHESSAVALFAAAVWTGPQTAVFWAQSAVNGHARRQGKHPPVMVDGKAGPLTAAGINALDTSDFLTQFQRLLLERTLYILENNPTQKVFERGWRARIARLDTLRPKPLGVV